MSCAWTRRRSRPVLIAAASICTSRGPSSGNGDSACRSTRALASARRRSGRPNRIDAHAANGASRIAPPNRASITWRRQAARSLWSLPTTRQRPSAWRIPSSNGGHCIAVSSAACDFSTPARPEASSTAPPSMTCTSGAPPCPVHARRTSSAGMPICAAASCASQSLALPWGGASCVALRNPSDAGACSPRSTCIAWSSRIGGGAGRGIQPTTATLARVASSRLASASIAIQRVVDHRLLTAPVPQRRSDTLPRAVSARGLLPRTRPARACGAGG